MEGGPKRTPLHYTFPISTPIDLVLLHGLTRARARLLPRRHGAPNILFVVGCQRAGTSIMNRVLGRALNTYVFRESSALSQRDPEKLRLDPLDEVEARITRVPQELATAKVLVDSQRVLELLDRFPTARAVWMFRDYRDVSKSSLDNFGEDVGIRDIEPIAKGDADNWRSEGASEEVQEVIRRLYAPDMALHDAAALFWWARNRLFFDLGLDRDPRVMMCHYNDFVSKPAHTMRRIYDFVQVPYPGDWMTREVQATQVGRGTGVPLGIETEELCEALFDRLLAANSS